MSEMKRTRLVLSLIVLFPLLAMSVSAQKPRRTPAVPDYFPLEVGNTWKYRHSEGSEFTIKVLDAEKQKDGTTRYKVETLSGMEIHSWYSKPNGWVLLHEKSYVGQDIKPTYDPPKQHLMNPLIPGGKWSWKGLSEVNQEASESYEVIGPENVTVAAGTFRAIKVVGKILDGSAVKTKTDWYADGIGLVKSTSEGLKYKYGWELEDYNFKKGKPKK
jgi:hypothetical protein